MLLHENLIIYPGSLWVTEGESHTVPTVSVPSGPSLRSWWELLTRVAGGPGVCSPLVCGLCWSFTMSAWSCLLLSPSSLFENSDHICRFHRGIAFLQRALQSNGCSSKTARQDQICCLVLSQKKWDLDLETALTQPVGSSHLPSEVAVCIERAHSRLWKMREASLSESDPSGLTTCSLRS